MFPLNSDINIQSQNYYFKNWIAYTEDHVPVQKIYISKVPSQLKKSALRAHLEIYGNVLEMKLVKTKKEKSSEGYALYETAKQAAKSLHSPIHHVNGHRFHVQAGDSWLQPEAYGSPLESVDLLPGEEAPIMRLNDYCLELILENLEFVADQIRFARTCQRFRAVYEMASRRMHSIADTYDLFDATVWEMTDFFKLSGSNLEAFDTVVETTHQEKLYALLGEHCPNLTTLDLWNSPDIESNAHKIFPKLGKLEELQVAGTDLHDSSIESLKNLNNLKILDASSTHLRGQTMDKLPSSIEELSLNRCHYFNMENLPKICKKLTKLKELNILNVELLPRTIGPTLIRQNCFPSLEIIRITVFSNDPYDFVARIPKLKHLSIYNPKNVPEYIGLSLFVQLVKRKSEKLERLDIIGPYMLNQQQMHQITKLAGLRILLLPYIETLDDEVLAKFADLKNLERIHISASSKVSDAAILGLFCACPMLSIVGLQDRTWSDKLVKGIEKKVREETKYKEMKRVLPIKLMSFKKQHESEIQSQDIVGSKSNQDDVVQLINTETKGGGLPFDYDFEGCDDDDFEEKYWSEDEQGYDDYYGDSMSDEDEESI